MIRAENVCFSYNRGRLLEGLSFEALPGECVALAGPNGAGKSTVLSLIAGITKPVSGRILTEGRIGLIPQGNALFEDMRVEDNLRFFAGLAHSSVPEELPFSVDAIRGKKVSSLSGGMKKRVSIACALLGDPPVLLFDEPCAGLDILYRDELIALIRSLKEQGRTILYVGHDTAEFDSFYDKLIFLADGRPQVFTREQVSGQPGSANNKAEALSGFYRRLCREAEEEKRSEV